MACDIKEAYGDSGVVYEAPKAKAKDSDIALQASLKELEGLLAALLAAEEVKKSDNSSEVLDNVLSQLTSLLQEVMEQDPAKAGELLAGFQPFFDRLVKSDPGASEKVRAAFSELFEKYALKNKDNVVNLFDFLRGLAKGAEGVMAAPMKDLQEALDEQPNKGAPLTFTEADMPHMPSLAEIFAKLVLAIQQLEAEVMDSEAIKSQILAEEGTKEVEMAQKNLDDIIKAIDKLHEAMDKAKRAGKTAFGIQIAVAVVGIALAALTMGMGAVIIVACVSAFMMSPAFEKSVEGISDWLQGMGVPEHEADALAKVIIVAAIMLVSLGVGFATAPAAAAETTGGVVAEEGTEEGIQMVAMGSSKTAVSEVAVEEASSEGGIQMVNMGTKAPTAEAEVADGAVEEGAETVTPWQQAKTFAYFQGISNLGATNPFMDVLEEARGKKGCPDWLIIFADVVCEILCMIVAMRVGATMVSQTPGATVGSKMPDWLVKNYSTLMQVGRWTQGGLQLAAAGSQAGTAYWQFIQADIEEKQGDLNAENLLIQTLISLNSLMQKNGQDTTQDILKGLEQALRVAQAGAGTAQAAANNAIVSH